MDPAIRSIAGEPECGAAAAICFEWLWRPAHVIAGPCCVVRLPDWLAAQC